MQLAKVELFGINICGQQRYSNNATNNNNCKSIGRNNDHPVLFVFVLYWYKCACVRVCVCVVPVHIVCSLFGFGLHFPICFVDYAIYLV